MGLLRLLDGLLVARHDKEKGKQKTKEGLYAMYNNLIPFLEVVILMPIVMHIIGFALGNNPLVHSKVSCVISLMACVLVMISVCLSLRAAELRKDCCADFDFEACCLKFQIVKKHVIIWGLLNLIMIG